MKKPRHLSPDEKALWESVANQAKPFSKRFRKLKADKPISEKFESPDERFDPFRIGQNTPTKRPSTYPITLNTAPPAMDAKAFGRLKKGKLKPEARIDLHGMTIAQAHPALNGFILESADQGKRLVLVITGKGRATENYPAHEVQRGVLRRQVPHWLSLPPLRERVLQTLPANLRHGGDGALYVYLRRSR